MFLSSISIKRPIMASMGLFVFFLFGLMAYFSLNLDLFPQVDIPYVTIQTVYPGGGPKEIESQVTKKIEDAVSTISKIDNITSYSMESVSFVIMKFEIGKDADVANQEVKDKVNAILNDMPDDADLPVIEKFDMNAQPVIDIVLSGNMSATELFEIADKKLKDRLSQIEGVAKVDIIGGEEREIKVEMDNRVVFQNAISLPQLAQTIAQENMDMPGGQFKLEGQEYSVRLKGEFDNVARIGNIEIPTPFGPKKLSQLAKISDTGAEVRERSIYFDNINKSRQDNVVLLSIIKSSDGNTVEMATGIKKELPKLKAELPAGSNVEIVMDKSIFIESSVEDTLMNIVMGIILTGLVLLFFLHDLRSTFIVALSMPFSIISTFLFMQLSGFSMNIMTLMGLSVAVGILVTNSVVVLENIFRHKEMGHSRKLAAETGTSEITVAVVASTMTNIVVFLPIASMSSLVGQFFQEFALTVTYATIFSLISSFVLTPMLASLILPEKDTKKHPLGEKLEKMFHSWETLYKNMIIKMLASKWRSFGVIAISVVMFVLTIMIIAPKVGAEFFPSLDEGDIQIEVELPQGYNLDQSALLVTQIENRIKQYDEVKHILTSLGSITQMDKGTNMAKIAVKLVDVEQREVTSNEAASKFIKDLSNIPNALIRVAAVSSGGGGEEAPITFHLQGQDLAKLETYKRHLVTEMKKIPGLINLNTSSRSGKPEITLIPKRKKIADAGLNIYTVAMTLRSAIEGMVVTQYREEGNEYDIRVCLTDESVNSPEEVGNISVLSPNGRYRLSQLVDIEFTEGYSKILHQDKYKSISFSGYPAEGTPLGDVTDKVNLIIDDMEFDSGYKVVWGGDVEMMMEMMIDMLTTFIIAFLLTYMLLAAILESLTQPLMILGTVPLALVGVFASLWLTGKTLNTMSLMAIIMLLGIVVNNAILQLDYANILRKKGKSVHDALVEACPTKLKAILMATIAIIFGMMPMAMGMGSAGVEFRQPLGIVSIGGLIVSTLLSLLVIPAIYFVSSKDKVVETVKVESGK